MWSGAWPETTSVAQVGPISGVTKPAPWSSWIQKSVVTVVTIDERGSARLVTMSAYTASWSSVYSAPTAAA